MLPDPSKVDAAVLALVLGDAALMALTGSAAFYGVGKQGYETFVLVERLSQLTDQDCFAEAAGETFVYLVKAVQPGTSTVNVALAATRIRELFEGNETLTIEGYALQRPIEEIALLREPETTPDDPDRTVQHWGGHYELQLQRMTTTTRGIDHAVPREEGESLDGLARRRGGVAQQVDAQRGDG